MDGQKGERGFKCGGDADDKHSRKGRKPSMMKEGRRKGEKEGLETRVGWINLLMDGLKYGDYTTKNNDISVPAYWNAKTQYSNHYIRMI